MKPADLAEWEAESAADVLADLDRLRSDLDAYPDSPTLCRLALRDYSGRVVGLTYGTDLLGLAWQAGAPAALIVEAEHLRAVLGHRTAPGYHRCAIRLAHRVRAVNAALRRYIGDRALPTVTVTGTVPELAELLDVLDVLDAEAVAAADSRPPALATHDLTCRCVLPDRAPPCPSLVRPSTRLRPRSHCLTAQPERRGRLAQVI